MKWWERILEKIKNRVKQEYEQYKESDGFTQYVMTNVVTLFREEAESLGADRLAKKIESGRDDVLKVAKAVDDKVREEVQRVEDKVREEVQQYKESDGFTQYVAGNAVSLANKSAKFLGEEKLAEKIESSRDDVLKVAKAVDDRVREEVQRVEDKFKNEENKPEEPKENNSVNEENKPIKVANSKKDTYIASLDYLYPEAQVLNVGEVQLIQRKSFQNTKIKVVQDEETGDKIIGAMVDGKPHGALLNIDSKGNIKECKLYDHGEEVSSEGNSIEYKYEQGPAGEEHYLTRLNGLKFGWELVKDKNGCAKVGVYEDGMVATIQNLEVFEQTVSGERNVLRDDLKNQSADEQHLTGQYALAQVKCDLSLHNAEKRDKDVEVVEPEEKSKSKLVAQATPVKVDVSKER